MPRLFRSKGFITRDSSRGAFVTIQTKGFKESFDALARLGNVGVDASRKTFNKGLQLIKKEIQNEAPVGRTGALKKSIKILSNKRKGIDFEAQVGPDGKAVNMAGVAYVKFVIEGRGPGSGRRMPNPFIQKGYAKALSKFKPLISDLRKEVNSGLRKSGIDSRIVVKDAKD